MSMAPEDKAEVLKVMQKLEREHTLLAEVEMKSIMDKSPAERAQALRRMNADESEAHLRALPPKCRVEVLKAMKPGEMNRALTAMEGMDHAATLAAMDPAEREAA